MSGKEEEEAVKKELLPSSKKNKSARFQIVAASGEEKGEEEDAGGHQMTHQGSHQITHQGSHQFTMYAKSFRHYLTRDVLPSESNYRNLLSFSRHSAHKRPTMQELRDEEIMMNNQEKSERKEDDVENQKKGKVIKFGWIEGVYMRCLLNIWGVMLFLRLTWVIGQCGIWEGLLCMTLCNVVTVVTTISMSAVATNGQISGGGVYFMISRSLGPEFGGAIGLMFTLANSIAVAMYTIGFAEALLDMFQNYIPGWNGIVDHDFEVFRTNDVRIIGSITIVLILVLAMVGMDWVTRVQKLLLLLLIASQIDFVVGTFVPKSNDVYAKGFTGWSLETAKENFNSDYREGESFFSVFAVFFPAVTGIVAGANLSGDLKDPGTAIPKGTLLAIGSTYVTYIVYGIMVGFTYVREASGDVNEYNIWMNGTTDLPRDVPSYLACTPGTNRSQPCKYGTLNDQQTMSLISVTGYLIYGGCFAATLSSAIASLVGAPRVLQALAKDKLYPKIEFFAPGWGANNDPIRGYVLVWLVAVGCILIAELNIVSSLLSNFFVAAYALINFSVFHASITKSPGWRPSFKYYSPWLSLFGVFLCLLAMFAMDWITALITFLITAVLYLYIYYRKPPANWGSSAQAQVFVNALKGVQSLTETQEHVKNYRPKILVLTGNPAHRPPLVDFANLLTKKLSLLICGHVITDPGSVQLSLLKESTQTWLNDKKIKGFYTVTENNSFEEGGKSCLTLAGLGKLSPNMLLIGFKSNWIKDLDVSQQYFNILEAAFDHAYSVGILRVRSGLDFSAQIKSVETETEEDDKNSITGEEDANSTSTDSNSKDSITKDNEESKDDVPDMLKRLKSQRSRTRTISRSVYTDTLGNPVSNDVIKDLNQFQSGKRTGTIDVWWLYDDGGLTLLLPYILTTRQQYSGCQLRVFTLANRKNDLDRETRNMAALLAKFRIEFSSVIVIPDVTKRATDETRDAFNAMIETLPEGSISEEEMIENKEKTNRHLRLSELLQEHSKESEMIFITLTLPRRGQMGAPLYLAWLDIMTRDLPPTLLIRGNQSSVLTFYS